MLLVLNERFLDLSFSDDCCCFVNFCAARWTVEEAEGSFVWLQQITQE